MIEIEYRHVSKCVPTRDGSESRWAVLGTFLGVSPVAEAILSLCMLAVQIAPKVAFAPLFVAITLLTLIGVFTCGVLVWLERRVLHHLPKALHATV